MLLLDGKAVAAGLRREVADRVAGGLAMHGRPPGLTVILVGDDPASHVYVRNKERACQETGIASETLRLPADTPQEKLLEAIHELNARPEVDGILLQLPLPKGLDSRICLETIAPDKDVDGFHAVNMGRLALDLPGFRPCTPAGVMALLEHYGLSPAGKSAVVVGRSNIVGKPLALMLAANHPMGNATVTICHSRTLNLAAVCRTADFLFLAMGQARCVGCEMVKPGAVVVDVGISRTEQGLCGDCDFERLRDMVAAITPVPGGVGPMTIAQLLRNTLQAYEAHMATS